MSLLRSVSLTRSDMLKAMHWSWRIALLAATGTVPVGIPLAAALAQMPATVPAALLAAAPTTAPGVSAAVVQVIGVKDPLAALQRLQAEGRGQSSDALNLRNRILQQVLLTSFDVDDTLARIDAEAAHVNDSRSVLQAKRERRDVALNVATFAISGTLSTAGSAMQLTSSLTHAGTALNVAGGAAAIALSLAQLGGHNSKRVLLSPYNMLAELLDQPVNSRSHYPAVVAAYLRSPASEDGLLPDAVPPQKSLRKTWYRLDRLQGEGHHAGASVISVTTDSTQGVKLTAAELTDREAMLRDLHGTVALLKSDLRNILAVLCTTAESPAPTAAR